MEPNAVLQPVESFGISGLTRPSPGIIRTTAISTRTGVFKGVRRRPEVLKAAAKTLLGKPYFLGGHPAKGSEPEWSASP